MKIPAYASDVLIGGEWRHASGGDVLPLENPSTAEVIGNIAAEGAVADGAPKGGHHARPTLFVDVDPQHELAQQEIFGPVVVVILFDEEEEALRIANGAPMLLKDCHRRSNARGHFFDVH